MKVRIISALVATVILFAVLLCPYTIVLAVALAVASSLAVWELLYATHRVTNRLVVGGCMAFSAIEVLAVYALQCLSSGVIDLPAFWLMRAVISAPLVLLAVFSAFMLLYAVLTLKKGGIRTAAYAYGLTLYATVGFSSLAALRMLSLSVGIVLILLPMVISWMSDMGAYFIGTFFGKHKMAPVISPKKSWEGFFGGWAVSIGASALYAVIVNAIFSLGVSAFNFAFVALLLAPLSVCGDLLASYIKRQSGIKDYSNIMPGHGGVMDRFDSVVCIAPLLYILLLVL